MVIETFTRPAPAAQPESDVERKPAVQPESAAVTTWAIDPGASRVAFTIGKRLLLWRLTVTGRFADVGGAITLDARRPANAHVDATIGVASVDTGIAKRDRHLLRADFFDARRYPTARFTSDRVESLDLAAGRGRVRGRLTFRGVTREVALDLAFDPVQASGDQKRLHVTASTEVNRRDFGLTWNSLPVGLTDTATITIDIVANRA